MNAKYELLNLLNNYLNNRQIKCAHISYSIKNKKIQCKLITGYTQEEYDNFIKSLDFEYDNGYGTQELFGTVWFENSWLSRYEYDGSEHWIINEYPEIPDYLNRDKIRNNKIDKII